jgi:hypothetical protein
VRLWPWAYFWGGGTAEQVPLSASLRTLMTWRVQMKIREPGRGWVNLSARRSAMSLQSCTAWGSRPKRTPLRRGTDRLRLHAGMAARDTAGGSIEQGGVPLLGAGGYAAFEEVHEGEEGTAGVAERMVEGFPVVAVFAVVIRDDPVELGGFP